MTTSEVATANVVIVEWDDLMLVQKHPLQHENKIDVRVAEKKKLIQDAIDQSYSSSHGIGIMAIRGVPNFVSYKDRFLIQAHALATKFTEEYLETHLTDKSSLYNAGWSYGKEQLGQNKPPDTSKGSFYYNPVTDTPGTEQDRKQYPCSYPCNVWPPVNSDNNALLPNFQKNAKQMGLLLKDVAVEIAKHLDVYVQNQLLDLQEQQQLHEQAASTIANQHHRIESIYRNLKDTDKVKARLLYYFPLSSKKYGNNTIRNDNVDDVSEAIPATEDSWIGWHNDSGFLTALAGDVYVNHATGQPLSSIKDIDPCSGLYVIDRSFMSSGKGHSSSQNIDNVDKAENHILKVNIPYDCCAIQIGECVQIITGGILCATPHCVRGSSAANIARISLPCFVDTYPSFPLAPPMGISRQQVLNADKFSHSKVPPLALRWKQAISSSSFDDNIGIKATTAENTMTFGEFLQETFQMYYGWESGASLVNSEP